MPQTPTVLEIVRRRDRIDRIDDRKLRAAIERGEWVRVVPGAFVRREDWHRLTAMDRHRLRVDEASRRMLPGSVISHAAAAAHWRMDILGDWPTVIDTSCGPARGGRSSGLIRRHPRRLEDLELTVIGEHFVTSPAQTALDLARTLTFSRGVSVVDQAIWTERAGGALTSKDAIMRLLGAGPAHRGDARALRAISFAEPLAANVRESQSRVVIAQLGFPKPRLQERRRLRSGRLVFGDFYWPEHDHWGELDGRGKYLSPDFGADRASHEIVIDEKRREDEIRREVRGFSRWEPTDVDAPRRLFDILRGDGLPSALRRP